MPARRPRIALTAGEPAGIGPDLCLMMQAPAEAEIVVIADPDLLVERAAALEHPFQYRLFDAHTQDTDRNDSRLRILPVKLHAPVHPGRLDNHNARYVLETLDIAIAGCMQGEFDALVTGPLHKGIINDAGIPFSGHTEYLAAATGTHDVVMMLATDKLRVALATTHLPLAEVSHAITRERLERVMRVLHHDLQARFGIQEPRIGVCGLNPHAGEGGHLGREEIDTIAPVIESLRTHGLRLHGPLPADTIFNRRVTGSFDAILAMYHDQGLPVLKYSGFGEAVNITLGLPFIRTSVDHGTALDRAGHGDIDPGSLHMALRAAIDLCRRRPGNQALSAPA